jgi:hypothetical protein
MPDALPGSRAQYATSLILDEICSYAHLTAAFLTLAEPSSMIAGVMESQVRASTIRSVIFDVGGPLDLETGFEAAIDADILDGLRREGFHVTDASGTPPTATQSKSLHPASTAQSFGV